MLQILANEDYVGFHLVTKSFLKTVSINIGYCCAVLM